MFRRKTGRSRPSSSPRADLRGPLLAGAAALVGSWLFVSYAPMFASWLGGDVRFYENWGGWTAGHRVPYRDFAFEYPPGALPLFAAPPYLRSLAGSHGLYPFWFRLLLLVCGLAALAADGLGARARRGLAAARLRRPRPRRPRPGAARADLALPLRLPARRPRGRRGRGARRRAGHAVLRPPRRGGSREGLPDRAAAARARGAVATRAGTRSRGRARGRGGGARRGLRAVRGARAARALLGAPAAALAAAPDREPRLGAPRRRARAAAGRPCTSSTAMARTTSPGSTPWRGPRES